MTLYQTAAMMHVIVILGILHGGTNTHSMLVVVVVVVWYVFT